MKVVTVTSQNTFFSLVTMTKMCTNEEIIAFYIKKIIILSKNVSCHYSTHTSVTVTCLMQTITDDLEGSGCSYWRDTESLVCFSFF